MGKLCRKLLFAYICKPFTLLRCRKFCSHHIKAFGEISENIVLFNIKGNVKFTPCHISCKAFQLIERLNYAIFKVEIINRNKTDYNQICGN